MNEKRKRFAKFTLIGWLGVVVQLVVLTLLTRQLHLPMLAATPIAVELTLLHNFLWHERFTWPERTAGRALLRLWRFHLGNGVVSLAGNALLMYCFVERLHLPQMPASLLAIALCAIANFVLADRWIFFDGPATLRIACDDVSTESDHHAAGGTALIDSSPPRGE